MSTFGWIRLPRTLARDLGGPALRKVLGRGSSPGRHRRGGAGTYPAGPDARDSATATSAERAAARRPTNGYPGDFAGTPQTSYAPFADGQADPGEIVWAWIPYQEDHSRGKDRPALVIGRDDGWLLALPVTGQDHDRDAAQEARAGRRWMDIGTGEWDPRGRPSEVRLNRIVRLDPAAVRREGAALDRSLFARVLAEMRAPAWAFRPGRRA